MPKNSKQMIRYLKKNGFEIIGYKGSHCKLYNKKSGKYTEVSIHSKELSKLMEHVILEEAGLKGEKIC